MSNGEGASVTWKWVVGVAGTIIVLGMTGFLTFTADRFDKIETTLSAVKDEISGMRADLREVTRLEKRIDRVEDRERERALRMERRMEALEPEK